MNTLDEIRGKIDAVDSELTRLFSERMKLAAEIAEYKKEHGLPLLNTAREREIIAKRTKGMSDEMGEYTKMFFTTLFDLSRSYQGQFLYDNSLLQQKIRAAMENTPALFPKQAVVACQGMEGANSSFACDKLFSRAEIIYMSTFDAVFRAVEKGLCKYGILPIENSLHGSVTEVYDLMKKYQFHISRSAKIKIDHTLLAKNTLKLEAIREIYSHPQALAQCSEFLKSLKNIKITECQNTAVAAEMVSKSERSDIAAIASRDCSELYGLTVISDDIQNNDNNYTRFICISKEMEIYPGANKISVQFNVPHRPGSLYHMISKFSALGVNLSKLESRPIPGKDFEFLFYADFEAQIGDTSVQKLLGQIEQSADKFVFLGSYSEI